MLARQEDVKTAFIGFCPVVTGIQRLDTLMMNDDDE